CGAFEPAFADGAADTARAASATGGLGPPFTEESTSLFSFLRLRTFILDLLVASCLAILVWLYMRSRGQETLEQVPIPVQVQLAANQRDQFDLQVSAPSRVA